MKASEARKLVEISEKKFSEKEEKIYEDIIESIKKAIEKDSVYSINYYNVIPSRIKTKLIKDGYKITSSTRYGDTDTIISWKDEVVYIPRNLSFNNVNK